MNTAIFAAFGADGGAEGPKPVGAGQTEPSRSYSARAEVVAEAKP